MQINRRKYTRARKGTIALQAHFRGITTRRELAAVKLETFYRMNKRRKNFAMLRSSVIALQCRTRIMIAKKELKGLMGEQKDIGKLKENNERLKMEMNSLKAMLAAQAKEDASNLAHTQELEAKQAEIGKLEKRVSDLEKQLAEEKAIIERLEAELKAEKENDSMNAASTHVHHHKRSGVSPAVVKASVEVDPSLQLPNLPSNYVSPDVLAKHKRHLAKLEEELRAERMHRREADGEIIKLRAAINGVQLNEAEVQDLLSQKLQTEPSTTGSLRYALFHTIQSRWTWNVCCCAFV
jgi:myosin heavy subunit